MVAALAIVQSLLGFMPLITTGAEHLWDFIHHVRAAAQQSGEWTPELEAAYRVRLAEKADRPESQPDKA